MPYKPKKPCAFPGCPNLVAAGQKFCEKHTVKEPDTRPSRSNGNLYSTQRWQRLRKRVLAAEPFCRECMKAGKATIATDVDHIVDHKGDPKLFWDPGNLQALCHSCHSMKTWSEHRSYEY